MVATSFWKSCVSLLAAFSISSGVPTSYVSKGIHREPSSPPHSLAALCTSHTVCPLTQRIAALCPGVGCTQDPWLSTSLLFCPACGSFSHCSQRDRLLEGCLQGSRTWRAAEALVPSLILHWLHLGDLIPCENLRFHSFVEIRRV